MIRLGATPIVDDAQPLSAILSQLQTRAQPKGNKSTACGSAHDARALNASFNVKHCKQQRDINVLPSYMRDLSVFYAFLYIVRSSTSAFSVAKHVTMINRSVYIINRNL